MTAAVAMILRCLEASRCWCLFAIPVARTAASTPMMAGTTAVNMTCIQSKLVSHVNMVRSSHRNKEEMRKHASEFEIAIRILSVELQTPAGSDFVNELKAWRRAIAADCRSLEVLPPEQDHDTKAINEVRSKTVSFAEYLDEWLHLSERQLAAMVEEMSAEAARLWPHIKPEDRKLPRLGAKR